MTSTIRNWAGNYAYRAARIAAPRSIEELRELVAGSARVKALGSRHSFNGIADTDGVQISLQHLDRVLAVDGQARTVTVEPGIRYGELCRHLHGHGLALHNLASLPHISVGGSVSTATHGSGDRSGSLASAVVALELVRADGELVRLQRGDALFPAAVVNLGALGVVARLTLQAEPAFTVSQHVYRGLPLAALASHLDAITGAAQSISLFTDWQGDHLHQVWLKQRVTDGSPGNMEREFFGAVPATRDLHPIESMPAENTTPQMGVPGPSFERLPHFRLGFTPSAGEELQSEYLVPRQHALEAVRAVRALGGRIGPHLLISEVRTIAADEFWMSPFYREPCVGIHFTWRQEWEAVRSLLPLLEEHLAPLQARPHWGKLFAMGGSRLERVFPRLADFRALAREWDPRGKFRNDYLDGVLGAANP